METLNIKYNIFNKDNMLNIYHKKSGIATQSEHIAEKFTQNTFISESGIVTICVSDNGAWGDIQTAYITFDESEYYIVLRVLDNGFKLSLMDTSKEVNKIELSKPISTKLIKSLVNGLIEYMYNERLI